MPRGRRAESVSHGADTDPRSRRGADIHHRRKLLDDDALQAIRELTNVERSLTHDGRRITDDGGPHRRRRQLTGDEPHRLPRRMPRCRQHKCRPALVEPQQSDGPGPVFAMFLGRQHDLEQRGVPQVRGPAHPGPNRDPTEHPSQPVQQHLVQRMPGPVTFHPDERLALIRCRRGGVVDRIEPSRRVVADNSSAGPADPDRASRRQRGKPHGGVGVDLLLLQPVELRDEPQHRCGVGAQFGQHQRPGGHGRERRPTAGRALRRVPPA